MSRPITLVERVQALALSAEADAQRARRRHSFALEASYEAEAAVLHEVVIELNELAALRAAAARSKA